MEYARTIGLLKKLGGQLVGPDQFKVLDETVFVVKYRHYFTKTGIKKYRCYCRMNGNIFYSIGNLVSKIFQNGSYCFPLKDKKLYVLISRYDIQRSQITVKFAVKLPLDSLGPSVMMESCYAFPEDLEMLFMIKQMKLKRIDPPVFMDYWEDNSKVSPDWFSQQFRSNP